MLIKAIKIAVDIHSGQKDDGGLPYILHPLYIMSQMDTEEEMIVAVLHDVLEDSKLNIHDVLKYNDGWRDNIRIPIIILTRHIRHTTYEEYIQFIKDCGHPIATKVKIADIKHNMCIDRIYKPRDYHYKRLVKYAKALVELGGL